MGLFDALFSPFSTKPQEQATQARIAGLNAGYNTGIADINRGLGQSQEYLSRAYSLYDPLVASAGQGATAYGNALGLGGQAGLDTARQTFTSLPGYREGIDTGLSELDRRAAQRGMLASGNTSADTLKFATDYANRNYGNYLAGLQPYLGQQGAYTGAQANLLGLQGANALDIGKLRGGLGYQTQQGIGNAQADLAMAPQQAGANLWGALLGLGKLGTSFIPKFG